MLAFFIKFNDLNVYDIFLIEMMVVFVVMRIYGLLFEEHIDKPSLTLITMKN